MRHCSLQSTSQALILCVTLSLTVQPGAQAADCEDIRSAISEGGEIDTSAASFCTSAATPETQAELLDMAVRRSAGAHCCRTASSRI